MDGAGHVSGKEYSKRGGGAYLLIEGLSQPFQCKDSERVLGHRAKAFWALLTGKAAAVVQGFIAEGCEVVAAHI